MRKKFSLLTVLVALLICAMSSCGSTPDSSSGSSDSTGTSSSISSECSHEYVKQERVEPTCIAEGVAEHYLCEGCEKIFVKDGESYVETTKDELVLEKAEHTVTGIVITTQPTKTAYNAGETFDVAGMTIKTVCETEDCEGVEVNLQDVEIIYQTDGATALKVGDVKVFVKYGEYTVEIAVTVDTTRVEKPQEDSTVFTYTGFEQSYTIAASDKYTVSGTEQTDAGEYWVVVSLVDKENCTWADGTTDDVSYSFIINQAENSITELTVANILCGATPNPQSSAIFGEATYTVAIEGQSDYKPLNEVVFAKGNYTLKATVAGTDNYNATERTVSFAVNHDMNWSQDGLLYGCTCGYNEKVRVTLDALYTVEESEELALADGTQIAFTHEDGTSETAIVENGQITVVLENGNYTVSANYYNEITLTVQELALEESQIVLERQVAEKAFYVSLGNNANANGLALTFTNVSEATDIKIATVVDGKVSLRVVLGVEYNVTSEIFDAPIDFGAVMIGEETEYTLSTSNVHNTCNENATFNASDMSLSFVGNASGSQFFIQGQSLKGEQWIGFKFKRNATTDGVFSTFMFINEGNVQTYLYFTSVTSQLAVRETSTDYEYPGVSDPYVFIKRHNDNGKLAYTVYVSAVPNLDSAWSRTYTTSVDYSEDSAIQQFGFNAEADYAEGVVFSKIYTANTQETLLANYENDALIRAFNVSLGNNANTDGLALTFANQSDVSDVRTATVASGKATLEFAMGELGATYAVTSEIFGAPISFGTVTVGMDTEYTLSTSNVHNNSNANASFNASDMSLNYVGNASGSQFFVQGQSLKGEQWFGFKFKRNATTNGVFSTFMFINEGNIQTYVYFISVSGQLAVRVATSENNWTEYKVNGEQFGYPGINDPYVFVKRHNDNGKVAYTIYMSATATLEGDGVWSYTCTTGVDYSDDSAIQQFGFNAEANYDEGVVFSNIYCADNQEKLLNKYSN